MKPKLNTKIIDDWLKRNDRSVAWLAKKIEIDPATMYYRMDSGSLLDIEKIAGVINVVNIKDLVDV